MSGKKPVVNVYHTAMVTREPFVMGERIGFQAGCWCGWRGLVYAVPSQAQADAENHNHFENDAIDRKKV